MNICNLEALLCEQFAMEICIQMIYQVKYSCIGVSFIEIFFNLNNFVDIECVLINQSSIVINNH